MASSMVHSLTTPIRPRRSNHNSSANQENLNSIYKQGPAVNGYDTTEARKAGNALLLGKGVSDLADAAAYWGFEQDLSLDYSENNAPAYEDVATGGEGLPASAWVPNPTSPGEGSVNAIDQGEAPEGYGTTPNPQWGNGPGVTEMSPAVSSKKIKEAVTIGESAGFVVGQGTRSWSDNTAG